MSDSPAPASTVRPTGLRERKKARTRAAIREHALRLFRERGYEATTVDQIAAAAEVSPSTFFRYFPTKEDVVLQDDFDLVALAALDAVPPEVAPIAAFRAAAAEAFATLPSEELDQIRQTAALTLTVPEVRARAIDEFARTIEVMATALARRAGKPPDDFAARNLAGAMIGVIMAATMPWAEMTGGDDLVERIDAGLAHLEAGLPL
ncbi:MAG TPA: TetR family transcriptional regulator [Streptosporangiaceae bacterium]